MSITEQVHWHEGLFLQPHHMQTMQRHFLQQVGEERRLGWSFPYGVVESRLSADLLENMVVGFDRLRLVMPSGLPLDVPANTDLPTLDIKRALVASAGAITISIGVPRWFADRGNAVNGEGDARDKKLFRVRRVDCPDENTGQNPQPMLVRRINARLLLESDDTSDLDVMPLLRLMYATGEKISLPRQDPSFIPPCLVLSGSPALVELVRDLANQVEASRTEQRIKLTSAGFNADMLRSAQMLQMLRLRTLSRFGARLSNLWQAPDATPFAAYIELRELLAELSALQPDHDQYDAPKYDHDNPAIAFQELSRRIRPLLKTEREDTWMKIDFRREGELLTAELSDDHFARANQYFLGIRTAQDPRQLARLVEDKDQFKLMPISLSRKKVWGVKLVEDRNAPLVLPAQPGLNYFRLAREDSERVWERIKYEKKMSLEWPSVETSDFKDTVALYLTFAPGAAAGSRA